MTTQFADTLRLNQYERGVRPKEQAVEWFGQFEVERKRTLLRALGAMIQQAHPQAAEVDAAIAQSELKTSHTPAVLIRRGPVAAGVAKAVALPESELENTFKLLLALLSVSDERRRRTECRGTCNHWWHEDLSDETRVKRILASHGM